MSVTEGRGRGGRSSGGAGGRGGRLPSGGGVREGGATMSPVGRGGRGFSATRPQRRRRRLDGNRRS